MSNKIDDFAKRVNKKVYSQLPKGWAKDYSATTAPKGCVWIHNNKSLLSGQRETGLLIEEVTPCKK